MKTRADGVPAYYLISVDAAGVRGAFSPREGVLACQGAALKRA